jgi:hypothetical protein
VKKHLTFNIQRPTSNIEWADDIGRQHGGQSQSGFKNTVAIINAWAVELRASSLGLRQPSAAFSSHHWQCKAAVGCRSPKPRGIAPPIFHPGYSFYETALKVEGPVFSLSHSV